MRERRGVSRPVEPDYAALAASTSAAFPNACLQKLGTLAQRGDELQGGQAYLMHIAQVTPRCRPFKALQLLSQCTLVLANQLRQIRAKLDILQCCIRPRLAMDHAAVS